MIKRRPAVLVLFLISLVSVVLGYPSIRTNHPKDVPIVQTYIDTLPPKLLDQLHKDALEVNKWERTQPSLLNGKYRTRWYDLSAPPTTSIELAIQYLKSVAKPPDNVIGAEWWTQHVPAGPSGSIIWHVDKDESIASNKHYLSHPALASILYLTSVGGPTAITDQWSPHGSGYAPAVPRTGALSHPRVNKYLVFHGELLHGVLPGPPLDQGYRLTFLVNWWTYKPEEPNCERLPPSAVPTIPRMKPAEVAAWMAGFTKDYDAYALRHSNHAAISGKWAGVFPNFPSGMSIHDSKPVRAPAAVALLSDKPAIYNYTESGDVVPRSTDRMRYEFQLPGNQHAWLWMPRESFPGETLWLVWNADQLSNVLMRQKDDRDRFFNRLVDAGDSKQPIATRPSTTRISGISDTNRDKELLLKTEL